MFPQTSRVNIHQHFHTLSRLCARCDIARTTDNFHVDVGLQKSVYSPRARLKVAKNFPGGGSSTGGIFIYRELPGNYRPIRAIFPRSPSQTFPRAFPVNVTEARPRDPGRVELQRRGKPVGTR